MAFLLWPALVTTTMMMMAHMVVMLDFAEAIQVHTVLHSGIGVPMCCACRLRKKCKQCKLSNYKEAVEGKRAQWFVAQRWLTRASDSASNCPITWLHTATTGFTIRLAGENFVLVPAPLMAMATALQSHCAPQKPIEHKHFILVLLQQVIIVE